LKKFSLRNTTVSFDIQNDGQWGLRLALGVTTPQGQWVAEMSTSDKRTFVTARE
jgi:hypothetical protein